MRECIPMLIAVFRRIKLSFYVIIICVITNFSIIKQQNNSDFHSGSVYLIFNSIDRLK